MNYTEMVVFIVYLLFMLSIGIWFFYKNRQGGEKTYFLGGRQMGPWVTALSAGASDMSAWVLMGLPTSIYALGLGQAWISIGLLTGYSLSWIFQAPRLRRFSIVANDAITIPQYLSNRFLSKSHVLQVICAIVFLIAYTIYSASSIKACGTLFNTVIGIDQTYTMYVAAFIIIGYTFLGGFSAVCWTDFYQGLMILGSLLIAPIFAVSLINPQAVAGIPPDYWNPVAKTSDIISGFGWGLGYFGMPHIIIRFMSLKSQKEMKKSAVIAISWTALICFFATMVGVVGRMYLGMDENINQNSLVFIAMVRSIFPALMSGILLSGVLAASMSTASSQLLASASAFASDVYKPVIRKYQSGDKEMLWAGRIVVRYLLRSSAYCRFSACRQHYGAGCQRLGRIRCSLRFCYHAQPFLARLHLPGCGSLHHRRCCCRHRLVPDYGSFHRHLRNYPRLFCQPCSRCHCFPAQRRSFQGCCCAL